MIVKGDPVPSEKLGNTALFDRLIEARDGASVLEAALAFAREVIAEGKPPKKVRNLKVTLRNAQAFFQFARNTVSALTKDYPAPLKCVEAVAAAVSRPFEEGLAFEQRCFTELLVSPEHGALRHAFFAERAAAKINGLPADTPVHTIRSVAVIGAGTMGGGI